MLTLKLLLMPPLIGLVTLVARRWGAAVGGWIGGLPLVAGPISVFLALEQGPAFAAQSALPSLAATLGIAGFARVYVALAPRLHWVICSLVGYAVFFAVALAAHVLPLNLAVVFAVVVAGIFVSLRTFPNPPAPPARRVPFHDIPLRMGVATLFVVGVTKTAEWLGPAWSGLLTPFPIMTAILAAFTHHQQGWQASTQILRGLQGAMFGFAAFFLVVGWALPKLPISLTYALAVGVTVGLNALVWRWSRR